MSVGKVMVTDVITVSPDDPMSDLQERLRDKRISGLPVVKNDKLIGLISIEDFIRCILNGEIDSQIQNWMSWDIKTLYENDPLVHAIKQFDRWGFGRFPVINRQTGKLVGIITKGDIVQGLLEKIERDYHRKEDSSIRTRDIFRDVLSDNGVITLKYEIIGNDFDRAGDTASQIKKILTRIGIPPPIARRIGIATYEAEMNVVIFTDGGKLTVRINHDKIDIEVNDTGPGIPDIEEAMKPGYSTAPDSIRDIGFGAGMGLSNIKKCSDNMVIESTVKKGTHLEFTVFLNGEERPS